jgi:lysophospholipid acyltransferase (LPLAT)-like uncharacterized protein
MARLAPSIYLFYMRLVHLTGRIDIESAEGVIRTSREHGTVALALLHQDLFCCPYLFRGLGVTTVASAGDAGDIIAAILERCGFDVLRGGTSSRLSRRLAVFDELVEQTTKPEKRIVAVTPDGSRGPAGAVQPGIALLASRTGARVYAAKIHASRALYMPTWDRQMVPLPFARIRFTVEGPVEAPANPDRSELESFRFGIERSLHELHNRAFADCGRPPIPDLRGLRDRDPSPARGQ